MTPIELAARALLTLIVLLGIAYLVGRSDRAPIGRDSMSGMFGGGSGPASSDTVELLRVPRKRHRHKRRDG